MCSYLGRRKDDVRGGVDGWQDSQATTFHFDTLPVPYACSQATEQRKISIQQSNPAIKIQQSKSSNKNQQSLAISMYGRQALYNHRSCRLLLQSNQQSVSLCDHPVAISSNHDHVHKAVHLPPLVVRTTVSNLRFRFCRALRNPPSRPNGR